MYRIVQVLVGAKIDRWDLWHAYRYYRGKQKVKVRKWKIHAVHRITTMYHPSIDNQMVEKMKSVCRKWQSFVTDVIIFEDSFGNQTTNVCKMCFVFFIQLRRKLSNDLIDRPKIRPSAECSGVRAVLTIDQWSVACQGRKVEIDNHWILERCTRVVSLIRDCISHYVAV